MICILLYIIIYLNVFVHIFNIFLFSLFSAFLYLGCFTKIVLLLLLLYLWKH